MAFEELLKPLLGATALIKRAALLHKRPNASGRLPHHKIPSLEMFSNFLDE